MRYLCRYTTTNCFGRCFSTLSFHFLGLASISQFCPLILRMISMDTMARNERFTYRYTADTAHEPPDGHVNCKQSFPPLPGMVWSRPLSLSTSEGYLYSLLCVAIQHGHKQPFTSSSILSTRLLVYVSMHTPPYHRLLWCAAGEGPKNSSCVHAQAASGHRRHDYTHLV